MISSGCDLSGLPQPGAIHAEEELIEAGANLFTGDSERCPAGPGRFSVQMEREMELGCNFHRRILRKSAHQDMAERVGVFESAFAIPNGYSGFRLISCNRNDLASSRSIQRFRPFAGFCRFFSRDGTRHGTRRDGCGDRRVENLLLRLLSVERACCGRAAHFTAGRRTIQSSLR